VASASLWSLLITLTSVRSLFLWYLLCSYVNTSFHGPFSFTKILENIQFPLLEPQGEPPIIIIKFLIVGLGV
jgi:hypothetical protein